jgi:hypothetical protein
VRSTVALTKAWDTPEPACLLDIAAGLTGAPDESGAKRREQGLAKAGNARVRRGMIPLAWRFLVPPARATGNGGHFLHRRI